MSASNFASDEAAMSARISVVAASDQRARRHCAKSARSAGDKDALKLRVNHVTGSDARSTVTRTQSPTLTRRCRSTTSVAFAHIPTDLEYRNVFLNLSAIYRVARALTQVR